MDASERLPNVLRHSDKIVTIQKFAVKLVLTYIDQRVADQSQMSREFR